MKIYIAASFKNRMKMRPVRDRLWELGHQVVSTWIDEVSKPEQMTQMEFKRKLAFKDVCEAYSADLLIQDTEFSSGGKNNEFGIAIGQFQNKIFWTVGEHTNIFQSLADRYFDNWDQVYRTLAEDYIGQVKIDAMQTEHISAGKLEEIKKEWYERSKG